MQLYEWQREFLLTRTNNPTLSTLLAALTSRVFVTTVMLPLEALRVRMGNLMKDQTFANTKGLKVTLIRDLTFSALFWTSLEATRSLLTGSEYRKATLENHSHLKMLFLNFGSGIINGTIIAALTTPLDTVKTRIQSDSKNLPVFQTLMNIYNK